MSKSAKWVIIENVKKMRISRKITRENLSLAIGYDNSYISKFEKGKINFSIEVLEKLAEVFEIPMYELFK